MRTGTLQSVRTDFPPRISHEDGQLLGKMGWQQGGDMRSNRTSESRTRMTVSHDDSPKPSIIRDLNSHTACTHIRTFYCIHTQESRLVFVQAARLPLSRRPPPLFVSRAPHTLTHASCNVRLAIALPSATTSSRRQWRAWDATRRLCLWGHRCCMPWARSTVGR